MTNLNFKRSKEIQNKYKHLLVNKGCFYNAKAVLIQESDSNLVYCEGHVTNQELNKVFGTAIVTRHGWLRDTSSDEYLETTPAWMKMNKGNVYDNIQEYTLEEVLNRTGLNVGDDVMTMLEGDNLGGCYIEDDFGHGAMNMRQEEFRKQCDKLL